MDVLTPAVTALFEPRNATEGFSHFFPIRDFSPFHPLKMTSDIPFRDYPAKEHASNVAKYLKSKYLTEKYGEEHNHNVVIYLEAQKTRMIEDSDEAMLFRY